MIVNKKYKLCTVHNWERLHPGKNFFQEKRKQRINLVSEKRKKEGPEYTKKRREFLKGKRCAVFPHLPATEVHHKRGRGKYYLDVSTWLPVSREGHKKITDNPAWAMEKGFSESRLRNYNM